MSNLFHFHEGIEFERIRELVFGLWVSLWGCFWRSSGGKRDSRHQGGLLDRFLDHPL